MVYKSLLVLCIPGTEVTRTSVHLILNLVKICTISTSPISTNLYDQCPISTNPLRRP